MISIDSIKYRILCDGTAVIQSCNNLLGTLLPRNYVVFNGDQVRVTHLLTAALTGAATTLLIPYSLNPIYNRVEPIRDFRIAEIKNLEYLVFESGAELQSITSSAFARFLAQIAVFATQSPCYWSKRLCMLHVRRIPSFWPSIFAEAIEWKDIFRIGSHFCNYDSL
jgi:hypothetical protein